MTLMEGLRPKLQNFWINHRTEIVGIAIGAAICTGVEGVFLLVNGPVVPRKPPVAGRRLPAAGHVGLRSLPRKSLWVCGLATKFRLQKR
jgi:hypothetical protein